MKSRLYTRTGDAGTTSLVGGARADKDCRRLDAYGTIDELNSWLGVIISQGVLDEEDARRLTDIQCRLFDVGTLLATPPESEWQPSPLCQQAMADIEAFIDDVDSRLEPLRSFILPGGTHGAALTHVARTVARRAERRIISLTRDTTIDPLIVPYINRLSDLLFAIARLINHRAGVADTPWQAAK